MNLFVQIFKKTSYRIVSQIIILFLFLTYSNLSIGQQKYLLGVVTDTLNQPIPNVSVIIEGTNVGTSTDDNGRFKLQPQAKQNIILKFSCLGYQTEWVTVKISENKQFEELVVPLKPLSQNIEGVYVAASQRRIGNIDRINVKDIGYMPNISGNFESLIKSVAGVSSSNELSSQYSVRGGNFDENLVYVNDIEIYRPFLVRSGQQEGLSFINPDMVSSVEFSAGAFNAEFGDKMSSVLNVHYRKPTSFETSTSLSLLGANATTEGALWNSRFTYLTGVRYKTSQYLLNTLDVKGDYRPSFIDWQGLFTFDISSKFSVSVLGNYSGNSYLFAPDVRETRFGVFSNSLQLKIYYDGQEVDKFQTAMGALTFDYKPSKILLLKLYSANYINSESETYDLLGQYYLNELDNSLGSSTYGDSLINVGIGGFLNHARNYLDAQIQTVGHIGSYQIGKSKIKWGVVLQNEHISDKISEWDLVDSSGYSLPYNGTDIGLDYVLKSKNKIDIKRASSFAQAELNGNLGEFKTQANLGCRVTLWNYTSEVLVSPRASISLIPQKLKNIEIHLATGIYYQPPFYKEMRLPSGQLNENIKSQKSIQYLVGTELYFTAWNRPFRFSTEAYYKSLSDMIPYKIDNVRITYSGENLAKGYAMGVDFKLNGEMVPGAESWVGFSLLKTMENIQNDSYIDTNGNTVYPGYYPRPTDQRFTFSMFFQDYLPGNPTFRVQLTGYYGSRLPFGVPNSDRYDINFRMPPYRRIDIGFTKILVDENSGTEKLKRLKMVKSVWLSAEVFNLFNFTNTISYLWVQTVGNQEGQSDNYAVPNYLTSRRVNLKLLVKF